MVAVHEVPSVTLCDPEPAKPGVTVGVKLQAETPPPLPLQLVAFASHDQLTFGGVGMPGHDSIAVTLLV